MLQRRHFTLAALVTVLAVPAAWACPNSTAAAAAPRVHPRAASLVAWKPTAWQPASAVRAASAGMVVERDPVTGELRMPETPLFTDKVTIGDDPRPIAIEHFADGRMTATLDERFAEFSVVTLGPDGKPRWT